MFCQVWAGFGRGGGDNRRLDLFNFRHGFACFASLLYRESADMISGQLSAEQLVQHLTKTGQYRVLRRLDLHEGYLVEAAVETSVGICIDVETTGLDAARDQIIELAMRRFRFDVAGVITKLDRVYVWREDTGVPLDPAISRLTGLTDADLAGAAIEDVRAMALINSASLCVAHNAAFDRRFVERRLPDCAGNARACSLKEIDWAQRGFDGKGRSLSWLLAQHGFFHEAHRASGDVDAVIAVLRHEGAGGRTALAELFEAASRRSWLIRAIGAHFNVKDAMKVRGYKWDADIQTWCKEVDDSQRDAELAWLGENVYAPEHRPRLEEPSLREITWLNRYA
jgi:DNA polymerase III subunit epsilon